MKQLGGPYRRLTFMGIVALGACGASYWQFQEWEKKKAQVNELLSTITVAENNLILGKSLSDDLKSLQELETKIKPNILEVSKKAANIGLFYNLEPITKIHIEGVVQDPIKETIKQGDQTYSVIPFLLTAMGTFESIEAFLNALHALPMFLQMHQLSLEHISSKPKEKDMHNIRLTLRMGVLGV